jgi:hypothetical protein
VSLLDQPPLDLDEARARLAELSTLIRRRAVLGLLLATLGATLIMLGAEQVGIPLLIGAAAAALLVWLGRDDRGRLLIRLVAQDDAWSIDEVRRATDDIVSPRARRRLADGLCRAADAAIPRHAEFSVVDPFRATDVAERLDALASMIGDLERSLRPSGAALCRRLLSEGRLSPLYNPRIDEADLHRLIDRIEGSIDPAATPRPMTQGTDV